MRLNATGPYTHGSIQFLVNDHFLASWESDFISSSYCLDIITICNFVFRALGSSIHQYIFINLYHKPGLCMRFSAL